MDSLYEWFGHLFRQVEPVQLVYGAVATMGGIARYLNSFAVGTPFNLYVLCASAFVSGFSGWMFAQIGISMQLPQAILFVMAGTGGFFGDQTMKFVMEWAQGRVMTPPYRKDSEEGI